MTDFCLQPAVGTWMGLEASELMELWGSGPGDGGFGMFGDGGFWRPLAGSVTHC